MTYLLKCLCLAKEADELSDALWSLSELKVQGIEESPLDDSSLFKATGDFEIIEFGTAAAQKAADWLDQDKYRGQGQVLLKVYSEIDFSSQLLPLRDRFAFELKSVEKVENRDYLEEYRKNVKGNVIGEKLWVGPPWLKPPKECHFAFFIEAGLAFGTGEHPTTQSCLAKLYEYYLGHKSFRKIVDIGTGTGVLALAAKRFFPQAEVVATDLDPDCRESFEKTFLMNQANPATVRTLFGEASHGLFEEAGTFDLVISNIYAEVLEKLCPQISTLLKKDSLWLSSGILEGRAEDALLQTAKEFFHCRERRSHLRNTDKDGHPEIWVMLEMIKK